jgi:hypothetical protein
MPDKYAVDHSDERDLDELLDRALASYVDQEPDPSLRTRVFARINEAAPPLRRMWPIGWLAAAACAAALLVAFLLYPANRPQNRVIEDRAVQAPTAPSQPPADSAKLDRPLTGATHPHVVPATRRRYRKEPIVPRPSISLGSAPLTEEEMILLRFAQQNPEQARQVLSPPPSGPLHTDPLVIAPIQIADLSGSQSDAH